MLRFLSLLLPDQPCHFGCFLRIQPWFVIVDNPDKALDDDGLAHSSPAHLIAN